MADSESRKAIRGLGWISSLALCAASCGCSIVNRLDACDPDVQDYRVNQRVDEDEVPDGPNAILPVSNNQVLVGYTATGSQPNQADTSSEVRVVLLSLTNGARTTLCGDSQGDLEKVLSSSDVYARDVSVSYSEVEGSVAAIGWTQIAADGTQGVKIVFLDGRGCPLGPGATSPGSSVDQTDGLSLAWSPTRHALLASYEDGRNVYVSWLSNLASTSAIPLEMGAIVHRTSSAIAPDGRALVAWTASTASEGAQQHGELRAALLDSDGTVLAPSVPDAVAAPFEIDLPGDGQSIDRPLLALTATAGRFAMAVSLAATPSEPSAVYVRQFDTSGVALGPWIRTAARAGEQQSFPSIAYAPKASLLVTWQSSLRAGSVAQLFDQALNSRFNSISCDEGAFDVGTRTSEQPRGYASIASPGASASDGEIVIVHPGQPAYDSQNDGVLGWTLPFSKLWPSTR